MQAARIIPRSRNVSQPATLLNAGEFPRPGEAPFARGNFGSNGKGMVQQTIFERDGKVTGSVGAETTGILVGGRWEDECETRQRNRTPLREVRTAVDQVF